MKLDPVFLLPPEPKREISRRHLVIAGLGCFTAGALAGTGLGWLLGSEWRREPGTAEIDERLLWARRIAAGPAEELRRHAPAFLLILDSHPRDEQLWLGFERLARSVLEDPTSRDARQIASTLADFSRRLTPPFRDADFADLARQLDRMSRR